jgi:hypothetical protein
MYVVTASTGPNQWAKHYAASFEAACWAIVKALPVRVTVGEALEMIGQVDESGGLIGPLDDGRVIEVHQSAAAAP